MIPNCPDCGSDEYVTDLNTALSPESAEFLCTKCGTFFTPPIAPEALPSHLVEIYVIITSEPDGRACAHVEVQSGNAQSHLEHQSSCELEALTIAESTIRDHIAMRRWQVTGKSRVKQAWTPSTLRVDASDIGGDREIQKPQGNAPRGRKPLNRALPHLSCARTARLNFDLSGKTRGSALLLAGSQYNRYGRIAFPKLAAEITAAVRRDLYPELQELRFRVAELEKSILD